MAFRPPGRTAATGPAVKRVWVPDQGKMANCACEMMAMNAADCMTHMLGMHSTPSAG